MPTDKDAAAAWRTLAEKADEQGLTRLAIDRRRIADALDPPKPTYPEGAIAWVTGLGTFARRYIAVRHDGAWRISMDGTGGVVVRHDENVTKVEPLRVLGNREIAVSRGPFTGKSDDARRYADKLHAAGFGVASLMYNRIADALDAEAGDAK